MPHRIRDHRLLQPLPIAANSEAISQRIHPNPVLRRERGVFIDQLLPPLLNRPGWLPVALPVEVAIAGVTGELLQVRQLQRPRLPRFHQRPLHRLVVLRSPEVHWAEIPRLGVLLAADLLVGAIEDPLAGLARRVRLHG